MNRFPLRRWSSFYQHHSKKSAYLVDKVPIEDHPKFGHKALTKQGVSLEHLEYLKQKSILENPLERWEQFDWNIDAEIKAFSSRLGICHETFPISDLKQIILSRGLEREEATEIEKLIEEVLNIILEAPEHVIMEIKESLLEDENIAKIAKSIGFIDLMQRKNPSSEEIATQFSLFIEVMEEIKPKSAFPIIGDLFTAEIVSSHNLISCWPRGWTNPMACLNEIIGDVEPRLVKSIGQNSALPTYVVALFDQNKTFISKSVGESPFLAAEDAARVALQSLIKLKID